MSKKEEGMAHRKGSTLKRFLKMLLVSTNSKGVSATKLHRGLGVTQKTAWFLFIRIRTTLSQGDNVVTLFSSPVEVDET
ncbi:MAG: hypothetical protein OXC19_16320 [Bryobacterales bacterium]|nr:hypothetical protein [Bryobacterales bacterium]